MCVLAVDLHVSLYEKEPIPTELPIEKLCNSRAGVRIGCFEFNLEFLQ